MTRVYGFTAHAARKDGKRLNPLYHVDRNEVVARAFAENPKAKRVCSSKAFCDNGQWQSMFSDIRWHERNER